MSTLAVRTALQAAELRASRQRALNVATRALFLAFLGYLVLSPLVRLQIEAFRDGGRGYELAFTNPRIGQVVAYTVGLALGSLVIAMVLGTALAWAASRLPARWGALRALPVLPIVIPTIASVVGWSFLLSPRPGYLNAALRALPWWSDLTEGPVDIYSLPWIVIITGVLLTSFVYLFVSSGFANVSAEHLEAAQVSGASPMRVFLQVTLPIIRPHLIYGAGVALLLGLGQFTTPLLLGRNSGVDVLTTEMYRAMVNTPVQYGTASALGSPLLLFGVLIVVSQRLLLGNQARFVTHGGKAFRRAGRPSVIAVLAISGYGFLAAVLPLLALVLVAVTPFWSGRIQPENFTLDNFHEVFANSLMVDAIWNSLLYSVAAMVLAIPIGFLAASLFLRGRGGRVFRGALDLLVALPQGVPAVIFGAGFLFAYSRPPLILYGTPWVVILVYVTLMLPFATRMLLAGMMSLGNTYIEAARASGAGRLRTTLTILLPLMRSSIGAAAAIIFVLLTHEFTASLLVRAPTTQVMGTVLYDSWGNGSYPVVAALAVVMSAVTAIGVVAATAVGGAKALSRL